MTGARRPLAAAALALGLLCGGAQAQEAQNAQNAQNAQGAQDAPEPKPLTRTERIDPWEGFNRAMFAVNEVLDQDLFTPLAQAYVGLVPELVRKGVSNVFNNAYDLWSAANHLMQGKLEDSTVMTMRFLTNSVFGVAGMLDIGTAVGMERKPEDFGQTLGVWGFPAGNYLVLPFFGPSSVRDAIGLPLDIMASPAYAIDQGGFRPVTTVVQILDTRARLLPATQLLDQVALDKYTFVREAYLTRRRYLVFDGEVPDSADAESQD